MYYNWRKNWTAFYRSFRSWNKIENQKLYKMLSQAGFVFRKKYQECRTDQALPNEILEVLRCSLLSVDRKADGWSVARIITPMPSAASIQQLRMLKNWLVLQMKFCWCWDSTWISRGVDVIGEHRKDNANGLYFTRFGETKEKDFRIIGKIFWNLQNGGCLGCIKTFPGLGASQTDRTRIYSCKLNVMNVWYRLFPYRNFQNRKVHAPWWSPHASYPLFELQEVDVNGKFYRLH